MHVVHDGNSYSLFDSRPWTSHGKASHAYYSAIASVIAAAAACRCRLSLHKELIKSMLSLWLIVAKPQCWHWYAIQNAQIECVYII